MIPPTPPLTPASQPSFPYRTTTLHSTSICESPEFLPLPPPVELPEFELPEASIPLDKPGDSRRWRHGMTSDERRLRADWLSGGRGRRGLRVIIVTGMLAVPFRQNVLMLVTENFLPKVDGVTRTLARLLEHLRLEGHECMLLGPGSGMDSYAGHPLVGTAGIPLVVYPGLKVGNLLRQWCLKTTQLNFLRPRFLRVIKDFVSSSVLDLGGD